MAMFGFDSAELSDEHRTIIGSLKSDIPSEASVSVVGYTDRTGGSSHNRTLSENRAKAVARELDIPSADVRGYGEELPLYDNSTPEGRFYSRTVEVIVESAKD